MRADARFDNGRGAYRHARAFGRAVWSLEGAGSGRFADGSLPSE